MVLSNDDMGLIEANSNAAPPSKATDAVLVASDPVPEGVQKVQGVEFNDHHEADITVAELVDGMANMGFQASAVGDAVRIINQMVRQQVDSISRKASSDCLVASLDGSRDW